MNRDNTPQLLLSKQFTSFEELADMAVAWDLDIRQVSKNYSATALEQVQAGNLLFTHISCGCFSTHAGQSPEDAFTFALPAAGCPDFRYFGRQIDRPVLLVSSVGQDFDLVTRPGYGMSTFSISNAVFDEYCETNFGCPAEKILESWERVISISPEIIANLRSMARHLSTLARVSSDLPRQPDPVQLFESQALECLFDGLLQDEPASKGLRDASRTRMLKRALEFIGDQVHEPLNVKDLSVAVNTSERTLRRLFDREFGISPKKYLYGQRMYGAHRQLWRSSPSDRGVADVANAWGFWHMGQFAKDYRYFFGELPSETLNRSSTTRAV